METKISQLEERIRRLDIRLDFVCGCNHALEVCAAAFMATSRDLEAFVQTLPEVENVLESRVLPAQVSEDFLRGVRETFQRFQVGLCNASDEQRKHFPSP